MSNKKCYKCNKKIRKPYFTDSCNDLWVTVKKYCWLVNKYPKNLTYQKEYYSYRSKYRRLCKTEEKKYKTRIYEQISQNMKDDPKIFWNLINKLNSMSENKTDQIFNETEFQNFFENNINLCKTENNSFHNHIIS